MKQKGRALVACVLALVMLGCLPIFPALAQQGGARGIQRNSEPTPACVTAAPSAATSAAPTAPVAIPTPEPSASPYIGTVVITKSGYQNARQSPADKKTIFRVHYGERYLCVSDTGDGWYEILLPTEETAFVSSDAANTTLLRDQEDDVTLSFLTGFFMIQTDKRTTMYSQPKSSAKMRRVSGDGSSETTFFYPKGSELYAFGMTTRDGKDWYFLVGNNDGVLEPGWVLAEECTVVYGDPAENIIPGSWYD